MRRASHTGIASVIIPMVVHLQTGDRCPRRFLKELSRGTMSCDCRNTGNCGRETNEVEKQQEATQESHV